MPNPIEIWKDLYYYPGTSTDLAKLLFQRESNRDSNAVQQDKPKTLTLYSLVTFAPNTSIASTDGRTNNKKVHRIEKIGLQLCSFSLVDRVKGEKKTEIRRSIQTELKRLLFPGRIVRLDPRIWSVRSYEQLVNVEEEFETVQVALGTFSLGFINPTTNPEGTYGISPAQETETTKRFRSMVVRLEREALDTVFLNDEDQDEATETME